MSPELAVSCHWRVLFSSPTFKKKLVMVAVDEAHCIPEWLAGATMVLSIVQNNKHCGLNILYSLLYMIFQGFRLPCEIL